MSQFKITTAVFWGDTRYAELMAWLDNHVFKKALFIIDQALKGHDGVNNLEKIFSSYGYEIKESIYLSIDKEPSYNFLDTVTESVRHYSFDLIIAIGGGSLIDLAKGIAILLKNPGEAIAYRGMHKVKNSPVPLIAVPTTAGTGTEVTWTAALVDDTEKKKLGINGKNVAPFAGLLEPTLVASAPEHIIVSSALDTMVHAIEAVTAKTATILTKTLGIKAFVMIYHLLPKCLEDKTDWNKWSNLQLAAYIAGIAMMNAGGGPASGISYPVGVHYQVPHGIAGGIFLPGVFRMNVEKGYKGYEEVFDNLNESLEGKDKSICFVNKVEQFYQKINAPINLHQWSCQGDKAVEHLTELTCLQRIENIELNPIKLERTDVMQLIERVCA